MPQSVIYLPAFADIRLTDIEGMDDHELDALPFGVIGLSADYLVEVYNQTESRMAGLSRDSVVGSNFFLTTAQCMNNFMVSQRFEDEEELDVIVNFVLTLRMRPTPARLRLLQHHGARHRYILVERTGT